uniref:Syndetin n=1 Tax=Caenorhabditis japonica TaxID=281687 RepID=A0A8R1HSQ7_CAEJA
MDRFKEQISRTVNQIGEQFSSESDVKVLLENMNGRVLSSYDMPSTSEAVPISSRSSQNSTPRKVAKAKTSEEDEVINSIDAAYFIDNDEFDAIDYELKKLCDIDLLLEDSQRERYRLKDQHSVVSKKISTLIMQKSDSYTSQVGEMEKIRDEVGSVLAEILAIRSALKCATDQTRTCLGLIANEKKKNSLKILESTLKTIKSFYETEQNIREVIEEGNFPMAIQMLIETQCRAANYKHFTCVNDVMTKLAGMSCLLETELTAQLSTISVVFDLEKYRLTWTAYEMLEKTSEVSEKLISAFSDAIETTTFAVLMEKVITKPDSSPKKMMMDAVQTETPSFASLCLKFEAENCATTFREMGFVICRSFHAFHRILAFHNQEASSSEASAEVFKALLSARSEIFTLASARFLCLVESRDFCSLKFDHILEIVDTINRFNQIGRQYFNCTNPKLTEAIEKRCATYFDRYHRERMDELAMFIENESFALCPVPMQFTIFDLQDFEFLKEPRQENVRKVEENRAGNVNEKEEEEDPVEIIGSEWLNPFCQAAVRSRLQSTYSQKSTDPDASKSLKSQDSILEDPLDEPTGGPPPPNLCNTALNLLRFFGRYIRMTALLPTLCDKSAVAIIELYEFFFASLCHLFGSEGCECVERVPRLATCLDTISRKFSKETRGNSPFKKAVEKMNIYPSLCPAVQISFIDNLYGLCERIIAVDSIEFVARQLDLIRPVIEEVRPHLHQLLDTFYTQILPCQSDARLLIFDASASRSLRLKLLLESVTAVKWDICELKSEHNPYVHQLIQDYELFALRVKNIKESETVNLSEATEKFLWARVIQYSFKALVQGYGDGGKCSTEGRALMQLDFQNIIMKLEPLCAMKPVPNANFVDAYIKAYYLPESGLEQWITSHSEYSSKQLSSLLGAAAHVSKKARVRILEALKD